MKARTMTKLLPVRLPHARRILITLVCTILVLLYISKRHHINSRAYYYVYPRKSIKCYHIKDNTLRDLSDWEPPRGKSIFFHETSCNSFFNGRIFIYPRQACAVESAAKHNPNFKVFLLFASPGRLEFNQSESDRVLRALLTYDNIVLRHINFDEYTKGTPVEKLYQGEELDLSGYAQSHASDILRYLTLYKFGGIYLDLDVIVTRTLENLPLNYAGSESDKNVAAGVLSFGPSGRGHDLALRCLEDLERNFKGHEWGNNGPGVITRLLREICRVPDAKDMVGKDCQGFRVYPPEAFYPVRWQDWDKYFDEEALNEVVEKSKNSYVVHVWNKHSVGTRISVNSKVPYAVFAQQNCPRVFKECREYF